MVDDEPQIHTFIRISLAAEGFEYMGADSLAMAKEKLTTFQPHVVVLDLGLPDGDGISLLTTIRQTSKTPVLILTARDQEEEKIRLLEAGANDYLSKPFGVRELIVRIKVLVRDLVSEFPFEDTLSFGRLKMEKKHASMLAVGRKSDSDQKGICVSRHAYGEPRSTGQTDMLAERDLGAEPY
ncbi:KDP operon transcriptional regulatory protein KdpE [Vibrio mimicus VM573]|nr:KDP operon transcriptional regulatory protein KdpE [Vibrio mimicus VM573]